MVRPSPRFLLIAAVIMVSVSQRASASYPTDMPTATPPTALPPNGDSIDVYGDPSAAFDGALSQASCPDSHPDAVACRCDGDCDGSFIGDYVNYGNAVPIVGSNCSAVASSDSTTAVATCSRLEFSQLVTVGSEANGVSCESRYEYSRFCFGTTTATCPSGTTVLSCSCLSHWRFCSAEGQTQTSTSCSNTGSQRNRGGYRSYARCGTLETATPTVAPTRSPTRSPVADTDTSTPGPASSMPSSTPTTTAPNQPSPSSTPIAPPTTAPFLSLSAVPTTAPITSHPTGSPSVSPTTTDPTTSPTTSDPTTSPSNSPTALPSQFPSASFPTSTTSPSNSPTILPSQFPSVSVPVTTSPELTALATTLQSNPIEQQSIEGSSDGTHAYVYVIIVLCVIIVASMIVVVQVKQTAPAPSAPNLPTNQPESRSAAVENPTYISKQQPDIAESESGMQHSTSTMYESAGSDVNVAPPSSTSVTNPGTGVAYADAQASGLVHKDNAMYVAGDANTPPLAHKDNAMYVAGDANTPPLSTSYTDPGTAGAHADAQTSELVDKDTAMFYATGGANAALSSKSHTDLSTAGACADAQASVLVHEDNATYLPGNPAFPDTRL